MRVTITGASGFLGSHLVSKFQELGYEVRCLGHSEKKTAEAMSNGCEWMIGDITDYDFLNKALKDTDLLIHAAAQKHVPIAEENPDYSIKTNILGTLFTFKAAIENKVREVILISTDKACNPQTIYGKTKEFGEWLCEYYNEKNLDTDFYWCRYGNVAASAGSVFEIWDKLGKEGKTLKITEPEMTRFFFTIDEAVNTIFETLNRKLLNRPYIPKMKSMRMGDVAEVFSEHYGVDTKIIGNRGKEKLHEDLDEGVTSNTVEKYTKEEIINILKQSDCLQ